MVKNAEGTHLTNCTDPETQTEQVTTFLQEEVREWHVKLFPEEYDHMYDSFQDARERRNGVNPMSAAYVAKVDERRAQLGFASLTQAGTAPDRCTYNWVLEKLRTGEETSLQEILTAREESERAAASKVEADRLRLQTPEWENKKIDAMLASDDFLYGEDRDDPKVIAVRVLGEFFNLNPQGSNEAPFLRQIQRVLPGKSRAQYANLFQHAMNEWMEIYCG